jgi:hypothetical protein
LRLRRRTFVQRKSVRVWRKGLGKTRRVRL